jgi:hypothetical protein
MRDFSILYFDEISHRLARVLVGNTCQGNTTMRVAPTGFDTTGDGQSIFGMSNIHFSLDTFFLSIHF